MPPGEFIIRDPGEFIIKDPCPLPPSAGPTSQTIAALDGAIAAAFPNFGPLVKDGENTYTKSFYIKPETLLNDVRPALMAQGILISSTLQLVKGGFVITTTLSHSGGGWRSSSFPIANPGDASKVSASATKGQRINLLMLLAIIGRDDDGTEDPAPVQGAQQWGATAQPPAQQQPWQAPAGQPQQAPGAWSAPGQPVQAPPATYGQPPAAPPEGYGQPQTPPQQAAPGAWPAPAPSAPPAYV